MSLSVSRKIVLSFIAVLAIVCAFGGFALERFSLINASNLQIRDEWLPRVGILGNLLSALKDGRTGSGRMVLLTKPDELADAITKLNRKLDITEKLRASYQPLILAGTPDEKAIADYDRAWPDYRKSLSDMANAMQAGNIAAAQALYLGAGRAHYGETADVIEENLKNNFKLSHLVSSASDALYTLTAIQTIITLGLAAISCIGLGMVLIKSLTKPINELTRSMTKLASGDLETEVPSAERSDEIGRMARAMNVFKSNAVTAKLAQAEAARLREESDAARLSSGEEKAREAAGASATVKALAKGLDALAQGDLTYEIDADFEPKSQQLKVDFHKAAARLRETMSTIASVVGTMRSGAGEISAASDDLSRRTEQQAASLEETAAALDEITATVRKTADGSKHARAVVGQAKQAAEQSGEVVRQAVDAMSGIEKSANQIGNIIGVIDEIAFQTNLLALNAGVEAARAGDAGRGFAVVASEVRALAQRSADAAKEIKALISASSAQVEQGVELVGQTGQSLERIVAHVNEINGIVGEIAASAQEQASGLDQVNTAVNQMDQVTQQNAAMVEETTAASHALAQETEGLAGLIGQFQLGENGHANASPVRKPARSVKASVAPKRVVALKTLSGAGAVRKPERSIEPSDWQEF